MVGYAELRARLRFWKTADRIGPDIPTTHWRLYFPSTMEKLCRSRFSHFGSNSEFRPGAYAVVCSQISIGDRVVVRPGTMLFSDPEGQGEIIIEDEVLIGSGVHIYTQNHTFSDTSRPIINQGHSPSNSVRIRRGSWIGASAVILPGVEIGENSVVGAGSIVTKDVPPNTIVAGNPAAVISTIAE